MRRVNADIVGQADRSTQTLGIIEITTSIYVRSSSTITHIIINHINIFTIPRSRRVDYSGADT
jgi:hypothetical protein